MSDIVEKVAVELVRSFAWPHFIPGDRLTQESQTLVAFVIARLAAHTEEVIRSAEVEDG